MAKLRNPFVAPTLREREDKVVAMTDSKEIFKMIKEQKDHLSYQQASQMLNDLAHVIVPFDKTNSEF